MPEWGNITWACPQCDSDSPISAHFRRNSSNDLSPKLRILSRSSSDISRTSPTLVTSTLMRQSNVLGDKPSLTIGVWYTLSGTEITSNPAIKFNYFEMNESKAHQLCLSIHQSPPALSGMHRRLLSVVAFSPSLPGMR